MSFFERLASGTSQFIDLLRLDQTAAGRKLPDEVTITNTCPRDFLVGALRGTKEVANDGVKDLLSDLEAGFEAHAPSVPDGCERKGPIWATLR